MGAEIIRTTAESLEALVRDRTALLEDLVSSHRETIELLRRQLNLNDGQIRAALNIVGEKETPSDQIGAKLVEIAEGFNAQRSTVLAKDGDSLHTLALKEDADRAAERGDLDAADALLAEVEEEQKRNLDHLALNTAQTAARRGTIALTRLRYAEAAEHFAHAAGALSPQGVHEAERVYYLIAQASALYKEGNEKGDSDFLRSAIKVLTRLVEEGPGRAPPDWLPSCRNNLGGVLTALGEREINPAKLEEAVSLYRSALQGGASLKSQPQLWTIVQANLASALLWLGERELGTKRMQEAITVLRATLRNSDQARWQIQKTLGSALCMLGQRESGTSNLKEAVAALRSALSECDRGTDPLGWAMIQNGLGCALWALGERQCNTATLKKSVKAHRSALEERLREKVPLQWATTHNNLGNTLQSLGALEADTSKIEEAIDAYSLALQERTRAALPIRWAETQNNLGYALLSLSRLETGPARLTEAIQAFRAALQERTFQSLPSQWEETQDHLAAANRLLSERQRTVLTR